jgi:hypothetical protein
MLHVRIGRGEEDYVRANIPDRCSDRVGIGDVKHAACLLPTVSAVCPDRVPLR